MALDVFDSAEESDGQAQSSARRQCKDLLAAREILHKVRRFQLAQTPYETGSGEFNRLSQLCKHFTDVVPDSDVQAKLSAGEVEWVESRPGFFQLDESELEIASVGKSLIDWNVRNRFCSICGSKTYSSHAGWKRSCPKEDCLTNKGVQNTSYPRTDPVVISIIISKDGTKCLLGRQKRFPPNMYSCIAGFMEPGETIEDAVRREAREETNIVVSKVEYKYSQPWPFPSQIMMGCFGYAETEDIDLVDRELEDAKWFTKENMKNSFKDPNNFPRFPPATAVAHWLIRDWVKS